MTASSHSYTCDQLGICQSRATPCTDCPPQRDRSLITEPLLLNTTRLHRVDASLLPKGAGVILGYCRTDLPDSCTQDCGQGRACTCAAATTSTQHTEPDVPASERDPMACAVFWWAYIAALLAVCWGTWHWLSR